MLDTGEVRNPQPPAVEQARRGVREWVRAAGGHDFERVHITPYDILAALTASAVTSVVGVAFAAAGVFTTTLGRLGDFSTSDRKGNSGTSGTARSPDGSGSAGTGITPVTGAAGATGVVDTTDTAGAQGAALRADADPGGLASLLAQTATSLRGRRPTPDDWRDAVAEALLPGLMDGTEAGQRLRTEIARVLRAVDAVGVALAESMHCDARWQCVLADALQVAGAQVAELRWMLDEVSASLDGLQRGLATRGRELRWQLGLVRRSLITVVQQRRDTFELMSTARDYALTDSAGRTGDDSPSAGRCPYPAVFHAADAQWFFGREAMVSLLLARLAEQTAGAGPLVVVQVPGVGASSLLRAGLLPAVAGGRLGREVARWPSLLLTPGVHPVADLVTRTAALVGTDTPASAGERISPEAVVAVEAGPDLIMAVRQAPERFGELAARAAGDAGRLLIVVDQFEELFTRCTDATEREAFTAALVHAAPVVLLLAVHADFYQHCARLSALAAVLADGSVTLAPMNDAELRRVILGPAQRVGLTVEPELVERLLADFGAAAGRPWEPRSLRSLGGALRAAWASREGDRLTVTGYLQAVKACEVSAHGSNGDVEVEHDGLHAADRAAPSAARMPRAARPGGLRAAGPGWLRKIFPDRPRTPFPGRPPFRSWQPFRDWPPFLGSSRRAEPGRREIDKAGSRSGEPSPAAAAVPSGQRHLQRLHRAVAGLAVALLLTIVGCLVALDQRSGAQQRAAQAESRRLAAESLVAAETDYLESMKLAVRAWSEYPATEARTALLSAQTLGRVGRLGAEPGGWGVALNHDGTLAAVGHADGTVRLWDTTTLRRVGPDLRHSTAAPAYFVAFSPDGRFLASGSPERNGVRIWEVPSGRLRQVLPGAGAVAWLGDSSAVLATRVEEGQQYPALCAWDPTTGQRVALIQTAGEILLAYSLAVSPNGEYVAMGTIDDGGRVWRRRNGQLVASVPGAMEVVFAPDGTLISTAEDGQIRRWELPSGRELRPFATARENRRFTRLAVTPDGMLLAATGRSLNRVDSWAIDNASPDAPYLGFSGTATDIAVSANGRVVAVTGNDGATTLWQHSDSRLGHSDVVQDVAFHPDGRRLATSSADGDVRVWDLERRSVTAVLRHPGRPTSLAYASDGTLATTDSTGAVRLWDATGRQRVAVRLGTGVEAANVTYAASGTVLAVTAAPPTDVVGDIRHTTVHLLDPGTLRERRRLDLGPQTSTRLALRPDGATLVVATTDSTSTFATMAGHARLRSWRTSDLLPLVNREAGQESITAIVPSPDGRLLAVAGSAGQVELRDFATLEPIRTPIENAATVQAVAFSPDQRLLATLTAQDEAVRLWSVHTGALVARLDGHTGDAYAVAFHPTRPLLATGSADASAIVWELDPERVKGQLCTTLSAAAPGTTADGCR